MNLAIIGCGYVGEPIARYWRQELSFYFCKIGMLPSPIAIRQQVVKYQR
ncbi:MAG: hypothetical protein LDL41_21725 [Coleofasciculus sp. S288]|nr:hypothetical protein [Coleofasciculus sp. S288]